MTEDTMTSTAGSIYTTAHRTARGWRLRWRGSGPAPRRWTGIAALAAVLAAGLPGVAGAASREGHRFFEMAPNLPAPEASPWTYEQLVFGSAITTVLFVIAAILFYRYTFGRMRRSRFSRE